MSLWRVEWLRLWRTRTVWILFGVFMFFGTLGPATARFLPEIMESAGLGGELVLPPPSPELAMSQYLSNALQIGLLAIAFVAASSLAFDSKPEVAVFYRTRATIVEILIPRYVVVTIAAISAFLAGTIAAFALSTVLIGTPDAQATLSGSALIALYIVFAVSLVGLMASVVASVPGAALLAVGTLIILGIVGLIPYVGPWLPSYLVGGFDVLIAGGDFIYGRAIVVTTLSILAAIWASTVLMKRREV